MTPLEIRACRERLGLSQAAFCERYGLGNQSTLSQWETGRKEPHIAAITLLRLIERFPDEVADMHSASGGFHVTPECLSTK